MNNFELQDACKQEIKRCTEVLEANFPKVDFGEIQLYWGTDASMKRIAGRATYRSNSVELNMSCLIRLGTTFIKETPAHEVAHLAEMKVFGTSGHGPNWQYICNMLNARAARSIRDDNQPIGPNSRGYLQAA
jgi:predicted SprT family Zn-dependent metalloprotease